MTSTSFKSWGAVKSCLFYLLLAFSAQLHASFPTIDLDSIPEEFRSLAEPQMTLADIFYGDRLITRAVITYTFDTVEIHDPADLVRRIPLVSEPDAVISALSGELPTNSSLVCSTLTQTDCGKLFPDISGVIFDSFRFRVDLFIAEPYLKTRTLEHNKYLPESSSSFGVIQGISSSVSGTAMSNSSQENFSFFGNTLLGWKESHLVSNWDITSNQDFSIDSLYLGRDANGWHLETGYLNSGGLMMTDFASGGSVLGFRVGSSMNTRLDMADVNATPVAIFTNGRRRVEVLRDDRLIYSTSVEAGSQEIDTRSFPHGAYNITLRIYDGPVLVQEFDRFFTKSVRLPPADETIWYLEGGKLTQRSIDEIFPENSGQWLLRGGLSRRVVDNLGVELRGITSNHEHSGELELFLQGDGWDVSATGMLANNNIKGASFDTSTSLGALQISYFHQRLWNPYYPIAQADNLNARLLGEGFENRSLSLSTQFFRGGLSASYSYNKRDSNDGADKIYSVSWGRNILRIFDHDLSMQLRYSQTSDNKLGYIDLNLRRSSRGWQYNARNQNRWNQTSDGAGEWQHGYALDSRWHREDFLNGKGNWGLRYNNLSGDGQMVGGDIKYEQARFQAEINADYVDNSQGDNYLSYTGQLNTSFAMNSSGGAIGGGQINDSAVIVEVDGSEQATFDVLIDGQPTGLVRGGGKTIVSLSPYGTYEVSIRARGTGFYEYDQSETKVTLYPGNVETIRYHSRKEVLLLGKLVDSQNNAIPFARITGHGGYARTDQFGLFQVQLPDTESQIMVVKSNSKECVADIPENYQQRAGVGLLGELKCAPIMQ